MTPFELDTPVALQTRYQYQTKKERSYGTASGPDVTFFVTRDKE